MNIKKLQQRDWSVWDWEKTPEADMDFSYKLAKAVGAPGLVINRNEDLNHWFWNRVLISEKDTVVRVYLDEKLVFTEFEDRFPSPENVAKLRLLAL